MTGDAPLPELTIRSRNLNRLYSFFLRSIHAQSPIVQHRNLEHHFSKFIGIPSSDLPSLIDGSRGIDGVTAREIETNAFLPTGMLDAETFTSEPVNLDAFLRAATVRFLSLAEPERHELFETVKSFSGKKVHSA